jgi:hypothetical protein
VCVCVCVCVCFQWTLAPLLFYRFRQIDICFCFVVSGTGQEVGALEETATEIEIMVETGGAFKGGGVGVVVAAGEGSLV